jgi:hypothetical protein
MLTLRRSLLTLAFAAIPLLVLPLACAGHADEPDEPAAPVARTANAPAQGIRVELTVPAEHASAEDIATIVEHLEGQADVAQAKAMVHKVSDGEGAEVVMELWGQDLPSEEELVQALETEFPYLAGTEITVSELDPEAETLPQEDHDEDPEALRQRIIADLRAKGVEGEIDVQITDHPDGRREVEVRVADDHPSPVG